MSKPRPYDIVLGVKCLCITGAQACEMHPEHLRTKEQKIAFRKAWDERVVE